ncbi:MAG: DegT/DnrJ/EryC1/StrS family aminotransferase [Planctomycetes bacterium]|nr:DegT/DnrJ/EryC1/StrS family aminotransferase [Planctomycetota bacterium]
MLKVGQEEADAVARVIHSGKLFRYHEGGECYTFEQRYARVLGVKFVHLCSSGTNAITAALAGLGIGPGDEVIVPAHTYMATAISVLAVGAIPVIADIDDSITLCPKSLKEAIGPRTKAVIPVHMWGLACDMNAIMEIAKSRNLFVIEDACQMVGGGYEGRMAGSIGHAGAFSFNFFKNMTCGEGGAVVTNDERVSQRARCMIDCCGFFWTGKEQDVAPFAASGARASEFEGALMNAQLDRIDGIITKLRAQKKRVLRGVAGCGLTPAKTNSLDWECGTTNILLAPTAEAANAIAAALGAGICGRTGRHTYTEWDQILNKRGAHHPALDPFKLAENRECRMTYSKDMCPRSLDILNRAIMIGNNADRSDAETDALIERIRTAAGSVLSAQPAGARN